MDPITLVVVFKGFGMLLVITGGIWIARYGYHLYQDGAGHGRDQAAFEFGKLKIKAHSVGSIVMSTAFLWAFAGVLLSPNLEKNGDAIRIYSMNTPAGEVEALALTTKSAPPSAGNSDDEKWKALLGVAIAETKKKRGSSPLASLNGKEASIDIEGLKVTVTKRGTGTVLLATQVTADGKTATLAYEPMLNKGSVTFVPNAVSPTETTQ